MRRVFLSFVEEDLNLVNMFRGQAKNRNSMLEFSDYSVQIPFRSYEAEYIRRKIYEKIRNVSVTVCLVGRFTHTSEWVEWELQKSVELCKGIVGVRLYKRYDTLPKTLSQCCDYIVDWNIFDIVDTIERSAKRAGY
jgi:hypothetical protein